MRLDPEARQYYHRLAASSLPSQELTTLIVASLMVENWLPEVSMGVGIGFQERLLLGHLGGSASWAQEMVSWFVSSSLTLGSVLSVGRPSGILSLPLVPNLTLVPLTQQPPLCILADCAYRRCGINIKLSNSWLLVLHGLGCYCGY